MASVIFCDFPNIGVFSIMHPYSPKIKLAAEEKNQGFKEVSRMNNIMVRDSSLTDVNESILILIDIQQKFLDKLDRNQWIPMVNRISWIAEMAGRFDMPIVVTVEDMENNSGTIRQVAAKLSPGTKEYNKMSYGLTGDQDILHAIEKTGRKTAVLIGLETDVCVCQSALGLLENGYRVVVLADAVGSPGPCHNYGIERMRNAGVVISSVKGTFYEWQRTVHCGNKKFGDIYKMQQPDGIYL
jgi:nicotinamidase-related amidase